MLGIHEGLLARGHLPPQAAFRHGATTEPVKEDE